MKIEDVRVKVRLQLVYVDGVGLVTEYLAPLGEVNDYNAKIHLNMTYGQNWREGVRKAIVSLFGACVTMEVK